MDNEELQELKENIKASRTSKAFGFDSDSYSAYFVNCCEKLINMLEHNISYKELPSVDPNLIQYKRVL